MSIKHLYNTVDGLVVKSLRASVASNPSLKLDSASKVVYVSESFIPPSQRISVIAGGGAGHEPAHAGYTGNGLLTACVSGEVFASPSAKQVLKAISVASGTGMQKGDVGESTRKKRRDVLVVINNYTGDILNLGLAIEKARVGLNQKWRDGNENDAEVRIESVVVADDVALLGAQGSHEKSLVGPRGLAGNILICKLLGALVHTHTEASIDEVKRIGDIFVSSLASIGVGLERCHIPGREVPKEDESMKEGEYELGLGLHGERGVKKGVLRKELGYVRGVIEEMVRKIVSSPAFTGNDGENGGGCVDGGEVEVLVFVNNLGGISQLEMGAVVDDALGIINALEKPRITVKRILCSSYMTSLNAPGFSISMMNLTKAKKEIQKLGGVYGGNVLDLVDAPTEATCWPAGSEHSLKAKRQDAEEDAAGEQNRATANTPSSSDAYREDIRVILKCVHDEVVACADQLTEFDTILGDGDCGDTFSSGVRALQSAVLRGTTKDVLSELADIIEDAMGGTIGALLAIFFTALASAMPSSEPIDTLETWSEALTSAMTALGRYTPACVGDRTFVDALGPFISSVRDSVQEGLAARSREINVLEALEKASSKARQGAERTRGMVPRLGRAVYVVSEMANTGGRGKELPPDPGAWGVAAVVRGVVKGVQKTGVEKN